MADVLLHTDIVRELMKPRSSARVVAWLSELDGFALSTVSLEEIRFGLLVRRSARVESIFEDLLEHYATVLPVTPEIAEMAATFRAEQHARGRAPSQADMLIAATAHVHGLRLATGSAREFERCGVSIIDPFDGR